LQEGERFVRLFFFPLPGLPLCAADTEGSSMFEFIRKHSKFVMILLFALVIPSFVFFGMDGYKRSQETGKAVATVDGHDITQGEWDAAHRQNVERMRAQAPGIDSKLLDSPASHFVTLERLVRQRVLEAAAIHDHLSPTDARLAGFLHDDPAISSLRDASGKLDMAQYRQVLAAQGMTPESFESNVRHDLAVRQVLGGVSSSSFMPPDETNLVLTALGEKRQIQLLSFKPQDFSAKINVDDAQIADYYKAHTAEFRIPEHASIDYVVLDLAAVEKTITISDSDLRTAYQQNLATLAGKEERRASHILITVPKDATPDVRAKAKAHAEDLLAQVRAHPEKFAEIAEKNSQDPGSASKGGDLDFFARGAMVKPFADAAFALKKGQISDLVTTDYGYHIIKLTDIRSPRQPSFEEMKPQLEKDLKKQQAQRKFAEAAEIFTNAVYEQSDSLKPVADRLHLVVQSASDVQRTPKPKEEGPLANPKLLEAIFAPDSIEKKRNTEAIETAPSTLVSARITQYVAARTPSLAEVKDKVKTAVVADQAAKLAQQAGKDRLAELRKVPSTKADGFSPTETVSRGQRGATALAVVRAAMLASTTSLPAYTGATLPDGSYAVIRIDKVEPAPATAATEQERAQVTTRWTAAESQAYYEVLKHRMKADIKVPKPVRLSAEG
jgi:peptidyl-prolyl cis-trans isomerase D